MITDKELLDQDARAFASVGVRCICVAPYPNVVRWPPISREMRRAARRGRALPPQTASVVHMPSCQAQLPEIPDDAFRLRPDGSMAGPDRI